MLFKTRFHAGIRDGTVTLTFRSWQRPRVLPGRRYRFDGRGVIEVESIEEVPLTAIGESDARRSGFDGVAELIAALRRGKEARPDANAAVYRVAFRFVGDQADPREALQGDVSVAALEHVVRRLDKMDRGSPRGAWTRPTLRLIDENPRVAASGLAVRVGREVRAFKVDVRKLKALGLTVSHEVGYELSPRGRAVLARERE